MKWNYWIALSAVALAPVVYAQNATEANPAAAALHALFDREWEWEITQEPLWASYLGDRRFNHLWPDLSSTAIAARQAHRESVLKDLAAIPRERLSSSDRLNYDLFRHQYQMTVEAF